MASWQPCLFFSKKLDPVSKYSAFNKELLVAYLGVRHFRFMLEGRPFTLLTDHKLLIGCLSRVFELWSACQQITLVLPSCIRYTDDIQHVQGVDKVVADALSC